MPGLFKLQTESVSEQYMSEMHDTFHCFATWLPSISLQIGDIGEMKHNEFTYVSNLRNKGIPFSVRTDPCEGGLEHRSGKGIKTETKLMGEEAIPKFRLYFADVGMVVRFGSKKGLLFEASGVKHQFIEDLSALDNAIADAAKRGEWKDEWVVISDLVTADSTTILIPRGKDASVVLKAKEQASPLSLADPEAGFEMTYADNMNTTIICESGFTPLYKVRGIVTDQRSSNLESTQPLVGEIAFKPF